jgi:oxidase EvaA
MKINIADTKEDILDFLHRTTSYSNTEVNLINLSEQNDWLFSNNVLSHKTNGFFSVAGLRNQVSGEERLILLQPQSALTGIIYCCSGDKIYLLLQARVEPGNIGIGQYGPTVQSTPANFLKWHGGSSTPYIEHFITYTGMVRPRNINSQTDIGKRYFHKIKSLIYTEVSTLLPCTEHMIWVSLDAISEAAKMNHIVNTDLRSMLAVMDWDQVVKAPKTERRLIDTDIFKAYYSGKIQMFKQWDVISLEKLHNWSINEKGIIPQNHQDVSVYFYKTSCLTREASSWVQPLMSAPGRGKVVLVYRDTSNGKEFLLSVLSEEGIAGNTIIGPTIQLYQEEANSIDISFISYKIVAEFDQSDEGGRFMHHVSTYQLIQVDETFPVDSNQFWLSTPMLKQIIGMSNLTSIQLRDICSVLLKELNPFYFTDDKRS